MRGADIVYSPDDDGWYAELFEFEMHPGAGGIGALLPVRDGGPRTSPTVDTQAKAEKWARGRGATEFLYP